MKLDTLVLGAGVLAFLALAGGCQSRSAVLVSPEAGLAQGLIVVGTGEARGEPDVARVDLGVMVRAPTVEAATEQVNRRMRSVLDALEDLGVPRKDIRTRSLSVHEERTHEPPPRPLPGTAEPEPGPATVPVTHYVARNTVEVTARDLDRLGELLGAVTDAGANQVHGIRFELDDPTALRNQAREKAVADAKSQARQLAELSGVRLGRVLSVHAGEVAGPRPVHMPMAGRMQMEAATAEAMPVERGELTVRQQVSIRYALEGD